MSEPTKEAEATARGFIREWLDGKLKPDDNYQYHYRGCIVEVITPIGMSGSTWDNGQQWAFDARIEIRITTTAAGILRKQLEDAEQDLEYRQRNIAKIKDALERAEAE